MQPTSVHDYSPQNSYDYLDCFEDGIQDQSYCASQPSFQHQDDDFDDYMNRLLTSSPSPPQRSGASYSLNGFPNPRYLYFGDHDKPTRPTLCDEELSESNYEPNNVNGATLVTAAQKHATSSQSVVQHPSQSEIIPGSVQGASMRLVATSLPDMFRGIFKFPAFNAMQTGCFDYITASDCDLVVSAPTGSGKTVLFELGIIKLLRQTELGPSKVVYVAPTKALCSERSRDWTAKFCPLGFKTCELTGDTVQFGRSAWGDAKKSSIIVTTAEKWDSLTRTWRDHDDILSQIRLFLVDEVHILNENRGSTLEVVISRMKTRNKSIRFLLVSATVPNIGDIASWIQSNRPSGTTCEILEFGEEYRPCQLTRLVVGVPRLNKQNEFQYATTLDTQLFPILQQHSVMKPILIFCSTRKGTLTSAIALLKAYEEAETRKERLPWVRPRSPSCQLKDKHLQEFATHGIGVHHAGLGLDDRRLVEDLFLDGTMRVLVATSTLSVGVNLPAHTVIIRGVKFFQNNTNIEYSDLEIMQMIGRAGRPQFDKDGLAIIMCEPELVGKYQALTQGKTVLESSLHHNMLEHLNSEIALGTITSIRSAKNWLRGSFLYQRLQKNPNHYAIEQGTCKSWQEKLDGIVLENINRLESTNLIQRNQEREGEELVSTEYGDIMAKFYIRQPTMAKIMSLRDKPTLREILEVIAAAEEYSSLRLRASERSVYNDLRLHSDIRYTLTKVEKTSDKVFLLIQAILGNIPLNTPEMRKGDTQPQLDAFAVLKHAARIAKVVVEVAITKQVGMQLTYGLEAARCLAAKAWEDRPIVLRQIEQIGEKSLKVLAEHGITTLDSLRQQAPARIEILLNRRSPFGHDVLASLAEIPQYQVKVSQLSAISDRGKTPVRIELGVECRLMNLSSTTKSKKKSRYSDMTAILTVTSDYDWVDFRRIPTKALREKKIFNVVIELSKPSQSIIVMITSESFAGTVVKQVTKPNVPPREYPTPNTRPPSTLVLELEEFENDPEFWNVTFDEEDGIRLPPSIDNRDNMNRNKLNHGAQSLGQAPRLPNGNYECNHTCADKTKCLHLCCREGKSHPSKKQWVNSSNKMKKSEVEGGNRHPETGQIASLERLHERSDVHGSLKMPKGHRLKLDSIQVGQKQKAKAAFEIQFTEVDIPLGANDTSMEDLPDHDDLPSIEQLLTDDRQGSPKARTDAEMAHCSPLSTDHVQRYQKLHTSHKRRRIGSIGSIGETAVEEPQFLKVGESSRPMPPLVLERTSSKSTVAEFSSVSSRETEMYYNGVVEVPLKKVEEFMELDEWLNSALVEVD